MAADDRPAPHDLAAAPLLASPPVPVADEGASHAPIERKMAAEGPEGFDFFQVLRRLEVFYRNRPRLGASVRPSEEPIRLGQDPSLAFPAGALSSFSFRSQRVPRLGVAFLGLFGPNGPLPLHLTEYARERQRNVGDRTVSAFADLFHHRALALFYRAWANAQPTVSLDRPESDRFSTYFSSLVGLGLPSLRHRDAFPDRAKLFFAGRLGQQSKNPEGLRAMIRGFFGLPAEIEPFVGEWIELPESARWKVGRTPDCGRLGRSSTLGGRAWSRSHKFRIALGPLSPADFQSFLPGKERLAQLMALVRTYSGDELAWDLRLFLDRKAEHPLVLGKGARLGWSSWLGEIRESREDLILDPVSGATRRVAG